MHVLEAALPEKEVGGKSQSAANTHDSPCTHLRATFNTDAKARQDMKADLPPIASDAAGLMRAVLTTRVRGQA